MKDKIDWAIGYVRYSCTHPSIENKANDALLFQNSSNTEKPMLLNNSIKSKNNKKIRLPNARLLFLGVLLLFSIPGIFAVEQLISLQGKITDSNGNLLTSGNVTVSIWDSETSGALVYNSSRNFSNNISNGFFDIVLGSVGANDLNLNLSQTYYMDLQINDQDIDWDGAERRQFQSPVGYQMAGNENFSVDTNVLFVDTLNNFVGINTVLPKEALVVIGNVNISGTLNASGRIAFPNLAGASCLSVASDGTLQSSSCSGSGSSVFNRENVSEYLGGAGINASLLKVTNLSTLFANTSHINVSVGSNSKISISFNDSAALCVALTGSAALCDGSDDGGAGAGGWSDDGFSVRLTTIGDLVGIGTTSPVEKLTVAGNGSYTGSLYVGGNLIGPEGAGSGINGVFTDDWNVSGSYLFPSELSVSVGIGTQIPAEKLVVIGNVNISGTLNASGKIAFPNLAGASCLSVASDGTLQSGSCSGTGSSVFNRENVSDYLGGSSINASLIKAGNISNYDASWTDDFNYLNLSRIGNNDINTSGSLNVSKNVSFLGITGCSGSLSLGTDSNGIVTCVADDDSGALPTSYFTTNITAYFGSGWNATVLTLNNISSFSLGRFNNDIVSTGTITNNITTYLGGTDINASLLKVTNLSTLFANTSHINVSVGGNNKISIALNVSNALCVALTGSSALCDASDDGAAGSVIGTGGVGNISYWTAANTLGNSTLFQSGASIGLGTSSPGAPLHIVRQDTNNFSTTDMLILDHMLINPLNSTGGMGIGILMRGMDNGSNTDDIALINATLVGSINGTESSSLGFYTRSAGNKLSLAMVINGSNIGLGTHSPTEKLVIIGNVNISGTLNASGKIAFPNLAGASCLSVASDGTLQSGSCSGTGSSVFNRENVSDYLGGSAINASLIKAGNVSSWDTGFADDFNIANDTTNWHTLYSSVGWKIANLTGFLGGINNTIVRFSNISNYDTSWADDFTITNYSNEYANSGFKIANATVLYGTNASNILWNQTATVIFQRDLLRKVGIGTANPTKKLSVNGTLAAITLDPDARQPTINTTGNRRNLTITSEDGSVLIQLG